MWNMQTKSTQANKWLFIHWFYQPHICATYVCIQIYNQKAFFKRRQFRFFSKCVNARIIFKTFVHVNFPRVRIIEFASIGRNSPFLGFIVLTSRFKPPPRIGASVCPSWRLLLTAVSAKWKEAARQSEWIRFSVSSLLPSLLVLCVH